MIPHSHTELFDTALNPFYLTVQDTESRELGMLSRIGSVDGDRPGFNEHDLMKTVMATCST